jgi:hypothetical protein
MARRAETLIPNRKKLRQAREELKALTPGQRDALHWNGIGPGDSYIGMWRMLNHYRYRLSRIQAFMEELRRRYVSGKVPEEKRRIDLGVLEKAERDERYCTEQIIFLYSKLLPHEKAKLQSITVSGDASNPLHHVVDLKGLPDDDLHALARILPKLGGSTEHDGVEGGDLSSGPRGDQAPGRGARAPAGRKKLRKA